jgi:hypothetical protein
MMVTRYNVSISTSASNVTLPSADINISREIVLLFHTRAMIPILRSVRIENTRVMPKQLVIGSSAG